MKVDLGPELLLHRSTYVTASTATADLETFLAEASRCDGPRYPDTQPTQTKTQPHSNVMNAKSDDACMRHGAHFVRRCNTVFPFMSPRLMGGWRYCCKH